MNQGQGSSTEFKQRGIGAACGVSLRIFRAKWGGQYRYWHFDLNAGSGHNKIAGCIGSPLAFLQTARECGVENYQAHFCDIDIAACAQLMNREGVKDNPRVFVHQGNNRGLVQAIPEIVSMYGESEKFATGTVLIDPNDSRIPLDELAELTQLCPRLDLIINWNSTATKRVNGAAAKNGTPPMPTLQDVLARLRKSSWLIRQPSAQHGFTLLIGRNFKVGDHKKLGFYHLDSDKGREIFDECYYTRPQLAMRRAENQMTLL